MVIVEFMGPINLEKKSYDVYNLKELSIELKKDKDISKWLEVSAISLNGKILKDISHPLYDGDRLVLLPPVCGG